MQLVARALGMRRAAKPVRRTEPRSSPTREAGNAPHFLPSSLTNTHTFLASSTVLI